MGNKQSNRSIQPFLLKYVNEISYEETINRNAIYNSVIAEIENEGPVVCKIIFGRDEAKRNELFGWIQNEINEKQQNLTLYSHPNILPYHSTYVRDKYILIFRQYVWFNLRERMSQKLELIEK